MNKDQKKSKPKQKVKKYELPPGYRVKSTFRMYKETWVIAFNRKVGRIYTFVFIPKEKNPVRFFFIMEKNF